MQQASECWEGLCLQEASQFNPSLTDHSGSLTTMHSCSGMKQQLVSDVIMSSLVQLCLIC